MGDVDGGGVVGLLVAGAVGGGRGVAVVFVDQVAQVLVVLVLSSHDACHDLAVLVHARREQVGQRDRCVFDGLAAHGRSGTCQAR